MCQSSGTGCPLCRSCAVQLPSQLWLLCSSSWQPSCPPSQLTAACLPISLHKPPPNTQKTTKPKIWINSSIKLFPSCLLLQEHKTLGPRSWAVKILPEGLICSLGGVPGSLEKAWSHPMHPFPTSHIHKTAECILSNKFHFTVTLSLCCGKRPGQWDRSPEPPRQ